MQMKDVIREKRRELGMTQEQVAERLGVSAPAVNKWERGNTCPDIMILPALARLLETDVNTLLCFREELTDQEIAAACEEVVKEANENGIDAGSDLAEKKIREYPNCMKLMYSLNTTLEGLLILGRAEITKEECRRYEEKIFARYEFILDHAAEEQTRNSAAYMLVGRYMRQGDCRRAEELLDLLPQREADKRILQANVLSEQGKHSEAARILEGKILGDINEVHIALFKLMTLAMDEGREEDAEEIAKIGQKTAEAYGLWGYNSILIPMELAVRQQDVRESVRYIREMIQAAKKPWTMPDIPLYRHISQQKKDDQREDKTESEHNMEKILPVLLKELKTDPRYDFLRGDEEFQELIGE